MCKSNLNGGCVWQKEAVARHIYASVSFGLHVLLIRSCNNESDWLIAGENTYPMIPGNARKCTNPYYVHGQSKWRFCVNITYFSVFLCVCFFFFFFSYNKPFYNYLPELRP